MRPDDAGPRISVMAPRGRPPAMRSTATMPVDITSATGFSRSLKAEPKRCANSVFESVSFNRSYMSYLSYIRYRKSIINFHKFSKISLSLPGYNCQGIFR